MAGARDLAAAIGAFGVEAKAKLSNPAAAGAPEDQLRGPLERLLGELSRLAGFAEGAVTPVGEFTLSDLNTRPDYAVTVNRALVGFIEVKAPGKGVLPARFQDPHDRRQWEKLKRLPNLLYTDGNAFSLWRNGEPQGLVLLEGDVATAGAALAAPDALLPLIRDFLGWDALPPKSVRQLADTAARLCRLLRDEVAEELERGNAGLTTLAAEWRSLLFPEADADEFADGYAQAVTFGLLIARARGIGLRDPAGETAFGLAALELRRTDSLIGTALMLLTDNPDVHKPLKPALDTLARVLDAVDWPALTAGQADAWLYFYEDFLAVYDNDLRKRTGSYYTPPEVVEAMVRLTDEALRDPALFDRPRGLASPDVTIADPAVGTGAYLLGALRRIAATVRADLGPGAVPEAVAESARRLIGFEMQFGPFAVAELRLMAEMQALSGGRATPAPRLFVTDTLGDPYAAQTQLSSLTAPIGESRRRANAIKRDERITVVIGNPPYKVDAAGRGGWIESGDAKGKLEAPMDRWAPPAKVGASAKHLKNLYVYFWRWATLKVFGSGLTAATGEPEEDRSGVICFITASGFLNGPGFQTMREDLRRDCSHLWVIDCSPEGHQPDVPTRVFAGVQQPVCIVLALRRPAKDRGTPALVRFRALGLGRRAAKFAELAALSLTDSGWATAETAWHAPLLPARSGDWAGFEPLDRMFPWASPGVKTHRTWVIAPDRQSLHDRWAALQSERDLARKEVLFHADRDRSLNKVVTKPLGQFGVRQSRVFEDSQRLMQPVGYAFRSFDRQWLPPDHRLISQGRTELWAAHSPQQIHLTALDAHSPTSGPAITFTDLIPDQHHYKGSFGGRVFPLWRDAAATVPNIAPALLSRLGALHGGEVAAPDVMAYVAALLAHPGFTARFAADLRRPGLRVPLTADSALFAEAARLGREVIWLHCYGERCVDPAEGRPKGPPRLPPEERPVIPEGGGIPGPPEPLPEAMAYDPAKRRLSVGGGFIDRVPPAVFAYEVSGKNVLRQWFSYRKRDRTRPIIGDRRPPSPLDAIQPDHWLPEYTDDLMNLLNVLGRLVRLEPLQADLLERVCAGPLAPPAAPDLAED